MMELVDVVDSKSTAGDSVPVRVRSPAPKQKATAKAVAFCFGFRPPEAASTLRYWNAQGGGAAPPPRFLPTAKTLVRRTRAAGPEGPLGDSPTTVPSIQNIDFYRPFQNERSFFRMSFHFGFRPPEAASTLRYWNAQGGRAALPPRFLPAAKTLVRRTRAAVRKGRQALLALPF